MNKRLFLIAAFFTFLFTQLHAQDKTYAAGLYADMMMESPGYDLYYGGVFRYDFHKKQAVKGYVGYSTVNTTSIGVDYSYFFLDKTKSDFNVFVSGGVSYDFYREKVKLEIDGQEATAKLSSNIFLLNPTVGVSYYVKPLNSSITAGYKVRYSPKQNAADINFLSVGLLYHW
ncbi:hypothetical protein [Sphingobacterium kyonggiense]